MIASNSSVTGAYMASVHTGRGSRVQPIAEEDKKIGKSEDGYGESDNESANYRKVLSHWFLLEWDFSDAISKGNHTLIPAALARVDFLKNKIKPELLKKGIDGDEDALYDIHQFLQNNGLWERARNMNISGTKYSTHLPSDNDSVLHSFIRSKKNLVHPNTWPKVLEGDQEGIRMALNQIHYGSISEAKKLISRAPHNSAFIKGPSDKLHQVIKPFLQAYAELIEPSVLQDALNGNDKALSLALGQIHHHSLIKIEENGIPRPVSPYKEALLQKRDLVPPTTATRQGSGTPSPEKLVSSTKLFFTGIDDSLSLKDLWVLFKKEGKIRDIILPKRRDKNGNKFGFLLAFNKQHADHIKKALHGKWIRNRRFYLAKAKEFSSPIANHTTLKKCGSSGSISQREVYIKVKDNSACTPTEEATEHDMNHKGGESPINIAEGLNILPDEEFSQVMKQSLFLRTVKNEDTESVSMMAEGLGAHNARIRGLSGTRFLAYFPFDMDWQNVDLEFLKIAFEEVRPVTIEDLIPSRKVWVELRGLPILGWTETNFRSIVSDYGTVLKFCRTRDEDNFYQTPKLLLESHIMEDINEAVGIKLMKKVWKVRIKEVSGEQSELYEPKSESPSLCSKAHPSYNEPGNEGYASVEHDDANHNVRDGRVQSNADVEVSLQNDGSGNRASIDEEVNSDINPVTPRGSFQNNWDKMSTHSEKEVILTRHNQQTDTGNLSAKEETTLLKTSNWIPREHLTSTSTPGTLISAAFPVVNDASSENEVNHSDSDQDILQELAQLKVKSRRGRPRKNNPNALNKHFKLPRKKKLRGEGLQQLTHHFLNNTHDEADSIYETAVMMGLLPIHSKEESMHIIRGNLGL